MRSLTFVLLLLVPVHTAAAQWRLTILHGSGSVWGHSRDDSSPDHPAFLPDRPKSYAVAIGRDFGRQRVTIDLRRTSADLALRGPGTTIVTRGVLHAWGGTLETARRLAGAAGRPTLHGGIGATVERWNFDLGASEARWRVGGRGALEVGLPISGRWGAVLRGELAASSSIFTAAELPEGYVRKTGWRRGMLVGVSRRW